MHSSLDYKTNLQWKFQLKRNIDSAFNFICNTTKCNKQQNEI